MNGLEIVGSIVVITAEVLVGVAALIMLWHGCAAALRWYVHQGWKQLFGDISEGRMSFVIERAKDRADRAWATAKREGASEHDCIAEAMNAYMATIKRYRWFFGFIYRWAKKPGNRLPEGVEIEDDGLYFKDYARKPKGEDAGPIDHEMPLEKWSGNGIAECFDADEVDDLYAFWAKHKPRIIPKAWNLLEKKAETPL